MIWLKYQKVKIVAIAVTLLCWGFESRSQTCDQQFQSLKKQIYLKYSLEGSRELLTKIHQSMTKDEIDEFASLSEKFKSIPLDTNENMNELYALQREAKKRVRTVTARAGFNILNPELGSPYDALIREVKGADGYPERGIEVRSLLIAKDPRPHITHWTYRQNHPSNPWGIVSLGIQTDSSQDYASWITADGTRATGKMAIFIQTLMPAECR